MGNDITIADVRIEYEDHAYRTPLKFGGVITDKVTLLNVTVRAFLEDLFHGDAQAHQFLTQDLPDQNEDVTVQASP